jgi:hypothetical protein
MRWPWEKEFWRPIKDIPGVGDVIKAGENVLGGLSGESDIGQIDYERRSAFESPEAQQYLEQIRKEEGSQGRFLNDQIRRRALGLAPSAAELQMHEAQGQAVRQQLAMASSARGGAGGQILAQRQAMANTADLNAEIARRAAMLRAQEQAQAEQAYLTGTASLRNQRAASLAMLGSDEARMQDLEQQAKAASAGAQLQMFGASTGFLSGLGGAAISGSGGGGAPAGGWTPNYGMGGGQRFYG